jgi:hypothetical protein
MTRSEFQQLLADPSTTEADLRGLVELDPEHSDAFQPVFRLKPDAVEDAAKVESALAINWLNKWSRDKRHRRYRLKLKSGYDGVKIVSEGDSWFQYPVLLKDVIDHLFEEFAIYSLGAGGDLQENMFEAEEYMPAIAAEQPDFFILSGGGNDLVGDGNLSLLLRQYDPSLAPEEYPNAKFETFERRIETLYNRIFDNVAQRFPQVRVVCHGYDFAIPANGKWLGKPMAQNGIVDSELQAAIVREIMNRFSELMIRITRSRPRVHFVDCRRAVPPEEWYDELHPTDLGFRRVAERFRQVLRS